MVYVFAKKPGDTVLYAVDAQDRVLLNTIVRVTSPLSRIKGALDGIHPGNGVVFDNQSETIVLSGTVRSAHGRRGCPAARPAAGQRQGRQGDQQHQDRRADPGPAARQGRRGQARCAEARRHQLAEHQQHRPVRHRRHPGRLRRQHHLRDRRRRLRRAQVPDLRQRPQHPDRLPRHPEPGHRAGRAQPDRHVGRDRELPGRRRDPADRAPGRHPGRHHHRAVQAGRRQPGLHADHHRRSHQPQGGARGQRALGRRLGQRAADLDRRRHHPGDPHPAGLDHDRAQQRPELRHRRPAAVRPRSRTSSSSRGSATSRCSARCSSRMPTSARRPSW